MSDIIEYIVEETMNGQPRKIHFQNTVNMIGGTFVIPTIEEFNSGCQDYEFDCEDETIDEDEIDYIIDNYFNNLKNQKV